MNDTIFALDIGTRSVVGIILQGNVQHYEIIDVVSEEHTERSMLDGQIHDILSVSKVIEKVKQALEEKHGPLQKVCVAAAGRALKTERASVTVDIYGKPMMTKEDILHFELQAVQQAQSIIASKYNHKKGQQYYCVGYSVLRYHLDNEEIGNLIDQQGNEASVEVIATFLPKVVVESLIAALHRAGLQMEALTLEPIAAINVLIPQSMRRLNVALVDIGAGTSDIALTDLGTVTAYGMVPTAGDEITEAVSEEFLLDFPSAEKAKRDIYDKETIDITDILGFDTTITREEFIEKISASIDKLVTAIANEILLLNRKAPKAVMLVGGGSLTPELPKRLARKLNLPENRVAIRGVDAIQGLTIHGNIQKGPEHVTPIGIAIASKQSPVQYLDVTVNQQIIRLFDMKKLTVGDCLLTAGIQMNKLYGKPGIAMIVNVAGKSITIPGSYGEPPILLKNDKPCKLDDLICNHDSISVQRGADGTSKVLTMKELIDELPIYDVIINGTSYHIHADIYQNNTLAGYDSIISDHDEIRWEYPNTFKDILKKLNLTKFDKEFQPFEFYLNEEKVSFPFLSWQILRNGVETQIDTTYQNGDMFDIVPPPVPTLQEVTKHLSIELYEQMPIFYQGQKVSLKKPKFKFYRDEECLDDDSILHLHDKITMTEVKEEPFIFQDIFRFVRVDIPENATGGFKLLRNDKEVTFYDPITPGDSIKIIFPTKIAKD